MAIVPQDNAHAQVALQNTAQQLRSFMHFVQDAYQSLNQNLSTAAQQTAAGFSTTADQNAINALIGDLNRLKQLMSGTVPTQAFDVMFDTSSITGFL